MLLMTSVPSADPARVSTSRADVADNMVTVYCERRPVRTRKRSSPRPPIGVAAAAAARKLAASLPMIVSTPALPVAFSMVTPKAIARLSLAPSEEKAPSRRSMVTPA